MTPMTFRVREHYLIGASFPDGRVAVLDTHRESLFARLDLETNCRHCFHLSTDGRYLATGYGPSLPSRLDIWDLTSGRVIASIQDTRAFHVTLSPEHRYVIWRSFSDRSELLMHDLDNSQTKELKGAGSPFNGSWTHDGKELLLPMRRGPGGIRISFDPFKITPLVLPSKHNAWLLIHNPNNDTFTMLEKDKVSCFHIKDSRVIWKRRTPDAGWLSYTGDGRFIALEEHAPCGGAAARIVVLDSATGETARKIEQPEQARYPLDGPKALCLSGCIANLETGEIEPGVSDVKWWHSLFEGR